jgi:hypothetical protein
MAKDDPDLGVMYELKRLENHNSANTTKPFRLSHVNESWRPYCTAQHLGATMKTDEEIGEKGTPPHVSPGSTSNV